LAIGTKRQEKGFPNNVQDPKWQSEESKDARHDGIRGVKVLFSGVIAQLSPRMPLTRNWPRRRDLYLATHYTINRETSMPPAGFEPTIASKWLQTYALDRVVNVHGGAKV